MKTPTNDPSLIKAYLLALAGIPATDWPKNLLKTMQKQQLGVVNRDGVPVL